jgi:hypothetical protein
MAGIEGISWVPILDKGAHAFWPMLKSNVPKLKGVSGICDDPPMNERAVDWERRVDALLSLDGPQPYRPGL